MHAIQRWLFAPRYYGWTMLTGVSIAQVVSWGILYYGFSVFLGPMEQDLGWSRVALTGAFSVALLSSGIAAVPVGRWIDRRGPRALMTAGSLAAVLLLLAWSQVRSLLGFYLVMIGIGITTAAVLYEPAFAIVAVWFRAQRGKALTLLTFFGAWASFIFIPLSNWLIGWLGWRAALVALAAILGSITVPIHALLLRRRPEDLGLHPDGAAAPVESARLEASLSPRAALRDRGFWWLSAAFGISTFVGLALTVHLIPYLVEQGHSPSFAATVAGTFGLMSLCGRMFFGPLGDRWPRPLITAGMLGLEVIALVVLALSPTALGAFVYVALFGAGSGTLTIMRAALIAERYGAANYGTINGAQNLVTTAARTLAPVGAGILASALGGYTNLIWALLGLTLLALGAIWQMSGR